MSRLHFVGLIGGGARSGHWAQLLATVLDRPLSIVRDADFVAALGAARLAITASGAAPLQQAALLPSVTRLVEPELAHTAAYAESFAAFRALYPALKPFSPPHVASSR